MQYKLAIIIPAYKLNFLCLALNSLSNQTCKDFTLYIGDDASKEDISSIVKQFDKKINIIYHRFSKNIGGQSLTKQWERCIALSKNEPYIWLFSDDDEMSEDAVSAFYEELEKSKNYYDLYRFHLNIIDEKSKIIKVCNYPNLETKKDFFINRIHGRSYSCITQYVFRRSIYNENQGFVSFPLAWFSDDASIIKFAGEKGIKKISKGIVRWRFAEEVNITSSNGHETQKARSTFEYAIWFNDNLSYLFNKKYFRKLLKLFFLERMLFMPIKEIFRAFSIKTIFTLFGLYKTLNIYIYVTYRQTKMWIKSIYLSNK
jgi:glycosyltransferase involved in cell wall biosynthesis